MLSQTTSKSINAIVAPHPARRQVIKSDYATVTFKELEFEIPPRQRGEVTTVEGLLKTSAERLREAQDLRMQRSPEVRA